MIKLIFGIMELTRAQCPPSQNYLPPPMPWVVSTMTWQVINSALEVIGTLMAELTVTTEADAEGSLDLPTVSPLLSV